MISRTLVRRNLTPLQRCSRWILQPQPTGHRFFWRWWIKHFAYSQSNKFMRPSRCAILLSAQLVWFRSPGLAHWLRGWLFSLREGCLSQAFPCFDRTRFIAWCLRHPCRGMPTGPRISGTAGYVHFSPCLAPALKKPCATLHLGEEMNKYQIKHFELNPCYRGI